MALLKASLQKIKQRPRGTEYRPDSSGKLGRYTGKGYTGRIGEDPKFSPQKRMHLNFGNEIPGVKSLKLLLQGREILVYCHAAHYMGSSFKDLLPFLR